MGNEELSTIPKKETNEFIKSSVENLVPIPSESEDTYGSDSDCDLPSCNDFSPINIPEGNSVTFSTLSSIQMMILPLVMMSYYPMRTTSRARTPMFLNLISRILLVTPLSAFNEDKCFDPGGDIDEIDAFLDIVVSTDIEDDYYDSEGEVIYLKSLLIKDTTPNLPPEVFLYHDQRSLEDEPDKDDLKNIIKVFDPGIHEEKYFPTYVSLPFEDRHYLSFTYVIRIFLPYFTYLVDSSLPLSSESEDIIF
ncbi:hypothetical protein Tco_1504977 [Tanacetum coccineum]